VTDTLVVEAAYLMWSDSYTSLLHWEIWVYLTMTYLHLNLEWFCILYRKLKLGVRILLRRSVLDTTLC